MGRNRITKYLAQADTSPLSTPSEMDMMDLWKQAVVYSNDVCQALERFPEQVRYELDTKIKSMALSISNHLARGFQAKSKDEFDRFMGSCIEAIQATVAKLMVAKSWNYIDRETALDLFHEGKTLARYIARFEGNRNE